MQSAFEDDYFDILAKARYGVGICVKEASEISGLDPAAIEDMEAGRGRPSRTALESLASALELVPRKLADFALKPEPARSTPPIAVFSRLQLGDQFKVNCYILACPKTLEAVIVDPGFDPARVAAEIDRLKAIPSAVFITHGHLDHTGGLEELCRRYRIPMVALGQERSSISSAGPRCVFVEPGHQFTVGTLQLTLHHVPGHTPGMGVLAAENPRVAFTGDALFARSLGRCSAPGRIYRRFLQAVEERILTLPPDTALCPGHGPMTTVEDEKRLNPFFK